MSDIKDSANTSLAKQSNNNQVQKHGDKVLQVKDTLEKLKPQLKDAMLRKIKPDYLISIATTILRTRPELQECTPLSIVSAIFQSAQTNLSLDPVLKHASLVSRWNNKTKSKEAQFMPEFRGYQELARRSGEILDIIAQMVRDTDYFEIEYGTNAHMTHRVNVKKDGKIIGAYAYAKLKSGGFVAEFMTLDEINGIMNRTTSKIEGKIVGPWATDWNEMARKTLVRRLSKYLPLTTEMAKAVQADEIVATGGEQRIDPTTGDIEPEEVQTAQVVTDEPAQLQESVVDEYEKNALALQDMIEKAKNERFLTAAGEAVEKRWTEGAITDARHTELKALVESKLAGVKK